MAYEGLEKLLKYNDVLASDEKLTGLYDNNPFELDEQSKNNKTIDDVLNMLSVTPGEEDRAKELEANRQYRHLSDGQLQRNFDGTLETDTTPEVYAKYAFNKGIDALDWLLEATTNIVDFGQGDWLDNAHIDYVYKGKDYSMQNKDIDTLLRHDPNDINKIRDYIVNTPENPNADKIFYTLKKFDGFDENGKPKYLYKYGVAQDSVFDRYKNQFIEDGYDIVMAKRIPLAEEMENKLHSTIQALNNRALDKGYVKTKDGRWLSTDKASKINFGSGYTELYNKDILGIDNPSIDYRANEEKDFNEALRIRREPKYDGQLGESIDALQAGILGTGANLLDFVGNKMIGSIFDTHFDTLERWADQDNIDKYVGYNRRKATAGITEGVADFKQGNYLKSIYNIVKKGGLPSLAETIPDLALFAFDAPIETVNVLSKASKAEKVYKDVAALTNTARRLKNEIDIATKAGKLSRAEKMQKKLDELKPLIGETLKSKGIDLGENAGLALDMLISSGVKSSNALDKLKKAQTGFLLSHTANVNRVLNERIAEKKRQGLSPNLSAKEIAATWFFELPFSALDKVTDLSILKGNTGKMIKDAVEKMPEPLKKSFVTKLVSNAGKIATDMGKEAAQEYVQTWGETLGSQTFVGSNTLKNILENPQNQDEALGAALVGGVIGGMMHAGQYTYNNKFIEPIIKSFKEPIISQKIREENNIDKIFKHIKDTDDIYTIAKDAIANYTQALNENKEPTSDAFINNIISNKDVFKKTVDKAFERYKKENPNANEEKIKNLIANNIIRSARNAHNEIVDRFGVADSIIPYAMMLKTAKDAGFKIEDNLSNTIKTNIDELSNDFSNKVNKLIDNIEKNPEEYIDNYDKLSDIEKNKIKNTAISNAVKELAKEYQTKISNIKSSLLKVKGSGFNINTNDISNKIDTEIEKISKFVKEPKDIETVKKMVNEYGFKMKSNKGDKEYFSLNTYNKLIDKIDSKNAFKNFVLNKNLDGLKRFALSRHRKIFDIENPDNSVFKKFKQNLIRNNLINNTLKENEYLLSILNRLKEKATLHNPSDIELFKDIDSIIDLVKKTNNETLRKKDILEEFQQKYPQLSNHSFIDAKGNIIVDIDEMKYENDKALANKLFEEGIIGKLEYKDGQKNIVFLNKKKSDISNEKRNKQINTLNKIKSKVEELISSIANSSIDTKDKEDLVYELVKIESKLKEYLENISNNVFSDISKDDILDIKNKLIKIRDDFANKLKNKEKEPIRINKADLDYVANIGSLVNKMIKSSYDSVRKDAIEFKKELIDIYRDLNSNPQKRLTKDDVNNIHNRYKELLRTINESKKDKRDETNKKRTIKVKYQNKEYTVVGSKILNNKGKEVYKKENDGNRKRILLKADLLSKRAELITLDNGKKYAIYPNGSVYSLQTANEIKHKGIIKEVREKSNIYREPTEQSVNKKDVNNNNKKQVKQDEYVNNSGGAKGTDIVGSTIGKLYGFNRHNHWYYGKKTENNAPYGNMHISDTAYKEGMVEAAKAANRNYGYKYKTMKDPRLVRNWSQVKNSDAIFAIGKIVNKGDRLFPNIQNDNRVAINPTVSGGTGYAVSMAINHKKPVYVFDQDKKAWFRYDYNENDFVKINYIPKLTKRYALIGTRNINKDGILAIHFLYGNTLGLTKDEILNTIKNNKGNKTKKNIDVSEKRLKIQRMLKDIENAFAELEPSEEDKKLINKAKELRDKIFDDSLVGSIDNNIEVFNNIYNKLAKTRAKYDKGLTTVLDVNPENFELNKKEEIKDEKDNSNNQKNNNKNSNNDTIDEVDIEKLNKLNIETKESTKKSSYQTVGSIEKAYNDIEEPIDDESKIATKNSLLSASIGVLRNIKNFGKFLDKIEKQLNCKDS